MIMGQKIEFELGLEAEIGAKASIGAGYNKKITTEIHYINGSWQNNYGNKQFFYTLPISIEGNASIKPYLIIKYVLEPARIKFDESFIGVKGYLKAEAKKEFSSPNIDADARFGIQLLAELKKKVFKYNLIDFERIIYEHEWEPFWKKRIVGTPILNTWKPYNSTPTSIIVGNSVEDFASGIDEKGFCINTRPNLMSCEIDKKITTDLLNKTTEFTLTNLLSNTTYYYRPFAKNKYGIGYGEEVSFTTLSNPNNPAANQYTLTTSITNGTITPTQNLNIGTQVKITYAASSGYKITAVYVNNIKQTATGLVSVDATNGYIWVTANAHKTINVITISKTGNNNLPPVSDGLSLANLEANMVNVPVRIDTVLLGCTYKQRIANGDGFIEGNGDGVNCVSSYHTLYVFKKYNFKICRFEVTQQLWIDVMGNNPSRFNDNLQKPIEQIWFNEIQNFITRLNELTGKNYRLPTDEEWEYAARGGDDLYFYSGGDFIDILSVNRNQNLISGTNKVGSKLPNQFGLFDMSGNVREFTSNLILRGGSYNSYLSDNRVSKRFIGTPGYWSDVGFRLAHD